MESDNLQVVALDVEVTFWAGWGQLLVLRRCEMLRQELTLAKEKSGTSHNDRDPLVSTWLVVPLH